MVSRLLVRLEPLLNASDRCLSEEDGACERSRRSSDEDAASNGATLVVLSPKVYTLLTLGEATPMQQLGIFDGLLVSATGTYIRASSNGCRREHVCCRAKAVVVALPSGSRSADVG